MTNFEKYKDQITDTGFAVSKGNKLIRCDAIDCHDCIFYDEIKSCGALSWNWLKAEYIEPKKIDLPNDLSLDAKIEVSDDGKVWLKRHFAGFNGDQVETWTTGMTSWTTQEKWHWEYARLPKEDEND